MASAATLLLDPQPGERVLDLCAAPGNKTAQIATALNGNGTVIARELEIGRFPALRHAIERLGLLNVATSPGDGSAPDFLAGVIGSFDAVLADVPCTSEGTSRKSRRVLRRCGPRSSNRMSGVQTRLLRAAVAACRPGGRVVYATCTYAPEENEAVVDAVLREASGSVKVRPARLEGLTCSPGLTAWEGQEFVPELTGALRIWPHQNDTGGFFIAVLDVVSSPPWRDEAAEELSESSSRGSVSRETASRKPASSVDRDGRVATGEGARADTQATDNRDSDNSDTDDPTQTKVLGEPADDHPAVLSVISHFGFPDSVFRTIRFVRRNRRGLHALAADHVPPVSSAPDCVGIFFVRIDGRVPKLSTAGALAFGAHATRHIVNVDAAGAAAYQARQDIVVPASDMVAVDFRGYVIVRHQGVPLGVGWVDDPDEEGRVRLSSQFPKGWSHAATG